MEWAGKVQEKSPFPTSAILVNVDTLSGDPGVL
jgi:hypothetical protein